MSAHTAVVAVLVTAAVLCALCAQAKYTPDAAMSALQFAKASYCKADDISSWSCDSCKANPSFSAPSVYNDSRAGTQMYVGVDKNRIVVAFRGSENIANWINNLDFIRTAYPNCKDCDVHSGFYNSYNSLKTSLLDNVRKLVKAHPGHSILVTGHSLGGAMATLAAADIAQLQHASGARPHIDLYTFGSPRVGNQKFADWFAKMFCSGGHGSYRVTHNRDMVPHLPPPDLGFVHVSREYFHKSTENNAFTECGDLYGGNCSDKGVTEDKNCSKSIFSLFDPFDHLQYLGTCTDCSCHEMCS